MQNMNTLNKFNSHHPSLSPNTQRPDRRQWAFWSTCGCRTWKNNKNVFSLSLVATLGRAARGIKPLRRCAPTPLGRAAAPEISRGTRNQLQSNTDLVILFPVFSISCSSRKNRGWGEFVHFLSCFGSPNLKTNFSESHPSTRPKLTGVSENPETDSLNSKRALRTYVNEA